MPYEEEARMEAKIDEILNRLEKIEKMIDQNNLKNYHINKKVDELLHQFKEIFRETQ